MRRYFYNWMWVAIIGIVTAIVLFIGISDILTATSKDGLKIISIAEEGERTIYSLDCGSMVLQFSAVSYKNLKPGDYIPAFNEFNPTIQKAVTMSAVFSGIVLIFFLLELFRVPDLILKALAKKGQRINGEIVGYENYMFGLKTVVVEGNGTKYRMKYPLTKRECTVYTKGTPATIWNGGRKRRWVELSKPSVS